MESFNANKKTLKAKATLKRLLGPLLYKIKKNRSTTYKKSPQPEYFEDEIQDNLANESLENEIFEEIDCCEEDAAISVYHDGQVDIVPIFRGERYIPVHFARTQAGTFFWTTMVGGAYPDADIDQEGDRNPITFWQKPELQVSSSPCRWAQA